METTFLGGWTCLLVVEILTDIKANSAQLSYARVDTGADLGNIKLFLWAKKGLRNHRQSLYSLPSSSFMYQLTRIWYYQILLIFEYFAQVNNLKFEKLSQSVRLWAKEKVRKIETSKRVICFLHKLIKSYFSVLHNKYHIILYTLNFQHFHLLFTSIDSGFHKSYCLCIQTSTDPVRIGAYYCTKS